MSKDFEDAEKFANSVYPERFEEFVKRLEKLRVQMLMDSSVLGQLFRGCSTNSQEQPNEPSRTPEELLELFEKFSSRCFTDPDEFDTFVEQTDQIKCIQMFADYEEGCFLPRVYKNEKLPEGFTSYWCKETNRHYMTLCNSCLCCQFCSDVFLDSGGPYGLICTKGLNTCTGMVGRCKYFIEEEN